MGLKEYFLNPKKRQVYVDALSKSVPTDPPPPGAAPSSLKGAVSAKVK